MNLELYYLSFAASLHVLAVVIWVGGMFFAYMALRPAAEKLLEPSARISLWSHALSKFFIWVWAAIIIIPITGYWMIFSSFNEFSGVTWNIHIMQMLGVVMILIFLHVFFVPFSRLQKAVNERDYQKGGKNLAQIRRLVGLNLAIGLLTIVVAVGFKHVLL